MTDTCYANTLSTNVISLNCGGIDLRGLPGDTVSANTFTLMRADALQTRPDSGRISVSDGNLSTDMSATPKGLSPDSGPGRCGIPTRRCKRPSKEPDALRSYRVAALNVFSKTYDKQFHLNDSRQDGALTYSAATTRAKQLTLSVSENPFLNANKYAHLAFGNGFNEKSILVQFPRPGG